MANQHTHIATGGHLATPAARGNEEFWVAGALVLAGACALSVDVPLARWLQTADVPGELRRLLAFSEAFAHGLGVALVLLAIYTLDPSRRRALPRVVAASLGAGILCNVVKMLMARTRPRALPAMFDGGVSGTFGPWLPLLSNDSGTQSFPSAHAATAAGLAVVLIWLYPRGRWLFVLLAVLAAAQRLESGAHYLSDVCFGAALGCVVARICIDERYLGKWFDRFEGQPQRAD